MMKRLLTILCIPTLLLLGSTEGLGLPPCEDSVSIWTNCFGTHTNDDGSKYIGGFKDDEPHGDGTYTFADGTKYVGEWKDGKRHRQDAITYAFDEMSLNKLLAMNHCVKCDLSGAILRKANLSEADLREAHLYEANLSGANLRGANLSRANLSRANLIYTNLTDADLTNTELGETKLTDAILCRTKVPWGVENRDCK